MLAQVISQSCLSFITHIHHHSPPPINPSNHPHFPNQPYISSLDDSLPIPHHLFTTSRHLSPLTPHSQVVGVPTNVPFLQRVLRNPAFAEARVHTAFIEEHKAELLPPPSPPSSKLLCLAAMQWMHYQGIYALITPHLETLVVRAHANVSIFYQITFALIDLASASLASRCWLPFRLFASRRDSHLLHPTPPPHRLASFCITDPTPTSQSSLKLLLLNSLSFAAESLSSSLPPNSVWASKPFIRLGGSVCGGAGASPLELQPTDIDGNPQGKLLPSPNRRACQLACYS